MFLISGHFKREDLDQWPFEESCFSQAATIETCFFKDKTCETGPLINRNTIVNNNKNIYCNIFLKSP